MEKQKNYRLWILAAAVLLIGGIIFKVLLDGHDILGYICMAVAFLVVLFRFLNWRGLKKLKAILIIFLCAGIVGFGIIEIPIIRGSKTDENPEAGYLVVLGAGVYGTTPSLILQNRLYAALNYLNNYPDAKVVVAGGQGPGEDITEAEAMRLWLTEKGIKPSRIIKEDTSTSTFENLSFSFNIICANGGKPADGVAIVSSEFHLYRAKLIAKSLGASPFGVAGKTSYPLLKLNYFLREGLAIAYMLFFTL